MTFHIRQVRSVAVFVGVLAFSPAVARADAVLHWNDIAVRTLTTQTPGVNPFAQARFAAIVQLAVFEAVNAITGEYEPYLGSAVVPAAAPIVAPAGASAEAAAISAAHAVLINYFPGSATTLNEARDAALVSIPDGAAKTDGVATGVAAAAALIALRLGDGSSPSTFYQPPAPPDPGEWTTTPGCPSDPSGNPLGGTLLNWRDVTPFGVVATATGHWSEPFRPAPPPALTSSRYAMDYQEVQAKGGAISAERTTAQEAVARFYAAASPTFIFLTAARQLAAARGDSLAENARSLALIAMATNDSLVASFATKYHYNYWRPSTAIRAGDLDGNRKTDADPNFATFLVTPCFPSYPSNHASGSNGAAETMRRIYGAAGHAITLSSVVPVIGPVTLTYTSLQQMCDDIDEARIYGGMHYRFDQVAGVRLGRDVATHIYRNNLQRRHGSK